MVNRTVTTNSYALIDANGVVTAVVLWDGVEFNPGTSDTPASGWSPPDGLTAVMVTNETGSPMIGLHYADGIFEQPPVPVVAVPTSDEILASNKSTQTQLIATATLKIAIYTDATDPDLVDTVDPKDTAALKAWKQYRVAVNKVDLTQSEPTWPQAPQS